MNAFWRRRREVEREIETHIAERTDDLIESGVPAEEARHRARREFGNTALLTESSREVWGWLWLDRLVQDLRYAVRMMQRSPGFTAVAVLSLALGIGANAGIFTLIESTLLRPIAVPNVEGLRLLTWRNRPGGRQPASLRSASPIYGWLYEHPASDGTLVHNAFSVPFFLSLEQNHGIFDSFFAFQELGRVTAVVDGGAEPVNCFVVSGDFYRGLNVAPVIGRPLEQANEARNADAAVVLISYEYWTRRFARDPSVVGRTITLNHVPVTIIGVNPESFTGVEPGTQFEIWAPLSLPPEIYNYSLLDQKATWSLHLMGRLKADVTDKQAESALEAMLQAEMQSDYPKVKESDLPHLFVESGARGLDYLASNFGSSLLVVLALSGLVLLIACANVANLLLSKSAVRQREISLRLALGADRWRIARQLLTEGLLLAGIAGVLGIVVGYWTRHGIPLLLANPWRPSPFETAVDTKALLMSMGITLATGVLFSLAPAWQSRRIDVNEALKEGSRTTGSLSKLRLGRLLVVLQVALSVLLLAGAALCVRTFTALRSMPTGFNPDHVLLFDLNPPTELMQEDRITTLFQSVQEGLRSIPGVRAATFSKFAMMSGWQMQTFEIAPDSGQSELSRNVPTIHHYVGSRFFETMDIPILYGGAFDAPEESKSVRAAVVNQEFARRIFQQENPVGRTFIDPQDGRKTVYQVVGVVAGARLNDLRSPVAPAFYSYWSLQPNNGFVTFEVKIEGDEAGIVKQIRDSVHSVNSELAISEVRTQEQQDSVRLSSERLLASLATVFGLMAVILSCIGIYGVVAYTVARRTGEIGIRMALGAQSRQVLWMVLRETLLLIVAGLAVGLPAMLALGPLLDRSLAAPFSKHFLYELSPNDPMTLGTAALALCLVGFVSSYLPSRRATRIDPMTALRRD